MVFVLGDSGASAKPAQDEPPLHSTQFLLTAGSRVLLGAGTVVSVTAGVKQSGCKVQPLTNQLTNQPGINTSARYSYSSYHLPFVSPLCVSGSFLWDQLNYQ